MSRIKDVENDIKAIRSNDLPHIYSRLGKVEGGIAVLLLLGIAAFARSFL